MARLGAGGDGEDGGDEGVGEMISYCRNNCHILLIPRHLALSLLPSAFCPLPSALCLVSSALSPLVTRETWYSQIK
ncbi:MAG: hypothetical protein RIE73_25920 [Coleofasciculus sp. C1-SOL-03]|jgi:hypothetical protein